MRETKLDVAEKPGESWSAAAAAAGERASRGDSTDSWPLKAGMRTSAQVQDPLYKNPAYCLLIKTGFSLKKTLVRIGFVSNQGEEKGAEARKQTNFFFPL